MSREFSRNGIDLLSYPLQVFGPDSNIPFEMPIFQALVSLLTFNVDYIEVTGRATSLAFFLLAGFISFHLVKIWVSNNTALLVIIVFLFSPFSFQWSNAFLIESFAMTLGLLLVLAFHYWIISGKKTWLIFGAVFTVCSFLTKATTGGAFLMFAAVPLLIAYQSRLVEISKLLFRSLAFATFAVFPALVATYFWVDHSDALKSETDAGRMLTSSALREWNFGTWQQKSDYATWELVSERIISGIWGPLGVISVTIAIFFLVWKQPKPKEITLVLGSAIVTVVVIWIFINLYYIHSYYLLAVYPMLTMTFGASVVMVFRSLDSHRFARNILIPIAISLQLTFHLTDPTSTQLFRGFQGNSQLPALSSIISANTEPTDLVVMVNCDWDPTILYFADRKGYMVASWMFELPDVQSREILNVDEHNYELLVFCTPVESPSDYVPEWFWLTELPSEAGQVFRLNKYLED